MDKRIILITLSFCLFTNMAQAQGYYAFRYYLWNNMHYHQDYKYQNSNHIDSYALANHLYSFTKIIRNHPKKGKAVQDNHTFIFDKNGRCLTRMHIKDTGFKSKVVFLMKRNFNKEGQMLDNSYVTLKKFNFYQLFEYNDSNKLTLATSFNDKQRITGQTLISYNETSKEKAVIYKRDKGKVLNSYNYYYYPDGKLKQIVLLDKKGKLIRVTDYTCDNAGKALKKIRDTAKVCTERSYMPDGSVVVTSHYFDYKGNPMKSIEVRDSMDLLLKYEQYKGLKEILHSSRIYLYSNGKLLKYTYRDYNIKKHPYSFTRIYDGNGKIVNDESIYNISGSKNVITKREYFYSDNGMLKSEVHYENGKLKSESSYHYSFYSGS